LENGIEVGSNLTRFLVNKAVSPWLGFKWRRQFLAHIVWLPIRLL